jgi:hypothetical protein
LTCTFNFVNARPEIHPTILRDGLRRRAIDEMTKGIEILSKSFGPDHPVHKHRLIDHFVGILSTIEEVDTSEHFDQFVEFTKDFDRARNQSFQKTFGYELYE